MNKKTIIPILITLNIAIGVFQSYSQSEILKTDKSFQVGFVPQYIIQHGLRIDLEPIFKDGKHHLQISPQFYYDENDINYSNNPLSYDYSTEYQKLTGYGAGLSHKIFIHALNDGKLGFYFSYGGEYVRFHMEYKKWDWVSQTIDGLEYLDYQLIPVVQNTDRIRANILIGIQYTYVDNLFLDFYIGAGGVYSFNNMDPKSTKPILKEGMYDYAFTGIYIPIGFRFGFRF